MDEWTSKCVRRVREHVSGNERGHDANVSMKGRVPRHRLRQHVARMVAADRGMSTKVAMSGGTMIK